jgi:hypothetical protein
MTLYGGILAEDLLPVPPSLETRTKRGFPHLHSDDDGGLLTATTTNPTKIGVSYRFLHRTIKSGQGLNQPLATEHSVLSYYRPLP